MTRQRSFTQAEVNAIAKAARGGVRLAMLLRPDGTKVIVPAAEAELPAGVNDLDDRLAAFGAR